MEIKHRYEIHVAPLAWCVYTHSHNNSVFYVGSGRPGRPFETYNRNGRWHLYVEPLTTFMVDILAYFDTMSAARKAEAALIQTFQPICNLTPSGDAFTLDDTWPYHKPLLLTPGTPEAQLVELARSTAALQQELLTLIQQQQQHVCLIPQPVSPASPTRGKGGWVKRLLRVVFLDKDVSQQCHRSDTSTGVTPSETY